MTESTKGGNVVLKNVHVPDSPRPGSLMTVEAVAENHAKVISPWGDADRCGTTPPGYRVEAEFRLPDGSIVTEGPACISNTDLPGADHTFDTDVAAPESEGQHEIQARLTLPGSGRQTGWMSQTFHFPADSATEPDRQDGGSGIDFGLGGDGGGDAGGSDPFNMGLSQQATLALIVVAILAVAWLADNTVGVLD
jgi:hypothetical protein